MYSPTNKPTRRKFLERSALGAGSLLFAPLLLDSCTDHRIPEPNPGPNPNPPLLGDDDADWNNGAKTLVTGALLMLPQVGGILSGMVNIFWPSSKPTEDIWGQVKAQVEDVVNQKIDAQVYADVQATLGVTYNHDIQRLPSGLAGAVSNYLSTIQTGAPSEILTQWQITCALFVSSEGKFRDANNQTQLLPFFAQFVNMYLSLLRDGVIYGESWGRQPGETQVTSQLLQDSISVYTEYAQNVYQTSMNNAVPNPGKGSLETWNAGNKLERLMILSVLNFMDTWPYFDYSTYPDGLNDGRVNIPSREIYTDAMGITAPGHVPFLGLGGLGGLDGQSPTGLLTQIGPRSGAYFSSIQVTYDYGNAQEMGALDDPNYQRNYTIKPDNPIIQVETTYDTFVNTVKFRYNDGTFTETLGITQGSEYDNWGFMYQALTSVFVGGYVYDSAQWAQQRNRFQTATPYVIYGFKYWQSPAETTSAIRDLYVTSPKEHSMADFAKAFPKHNIPANLITEDLKTARKKHWELIHASAHK